MADPSGLRHRRPAHRAGDLDDHETSGEPRPVLSPEWPTDAVTVVALFVVQSLAISSYGLDLPPAILGLVCTTVAVNLTEDRATARSRISAGNDATIAEVNPPTPDRRVGPPVPPR